MSLITVIGILIIIGVALWLVEQIPMDGTVKKIIVAVVIIAVVLWLLGLLGLGGGLGSIRIGG